MPLFTADNKTLNGYIPPFDREEIRFGFQATEVEVGGFMLLTDDSRTKMQYSINVAGTKIYGRNINPWLKTEQDIIALIVNEFLGDESNKTRHPVAWNYLTSNAKSLEQARRYWNTIDYLDRIEKKKQELKVRALEIAKAEILAKVKISEVLAGRNFTKEEKLLALAEFGFNDVEM